MKRIIITIIFMSLTEFCLADELSDKMELQGFSEAEVPAVGSDQWRSANRTFPAYFVEYRENLIIRKTTLEDVNRKLVFNAGKIKYIGIDQGEFGGGVYLEGKVESDEPLMEGNIKAIIPVNKDLYIIEGLAHLSFNGGSISVIRNYNKPSVPERITLLPDAPEAVYVEKTPKGRLFFTIVGHQSFMRFSPDNTLKVLENKAFWSGLYPSSIVKEGNAYYIGIRSGVAVVTTDGSNINIRYFLPK